MSLLRNSEKITSRNNVPDVFVEGNFVEIVRAYPSAENFGGDVELEMALLDIFPSKFAVESLRGVVHLDAGQYFTTPIIERGIRTSVTFIGD